MQLSFIEDGTNRSLIEAYTDGACSGNPGPAGLGVVLSHGAHQFELSEYLGEATNNIAELTAILRVLEYSADKQAPVLVHTDSKYAIGVLTQGWKAKANQVLIETIRKALRAVQKVSLKYVPGHAGIEKNERADVLARQAITTRHSSGWVPRNAT